MHFTFWPAVHTKEGGYREVTWAEFLAFVAAPQQVERKADLEGWSPTKQQDNRRGIEHVEAVSAVTLDVDETALSLEQVSAVFAGVSGVVHTTHSHNVEPPGCRKYRVILRTSRDMSANEYGQIWHGVRDAAFQRGLALDPAPKDPSRFWYVPGHRAGQVYAWAELAAGLPLDVDAILAATPSVPAPDCTPAAAAAAAAPASTPADRRLAMATALGAAWPTKGRHDAQLALAGALRSEGFTPAEAVDFLCTVCRIAGDENRPKREATVRHTWDRPAGAALTGWTRLKSYVDGVVVDAVRGALGRDAGWAEAVTRRLAEVAAEATTKPAESPEQAPGNTLQTGPVTWTVGGYDADLPPIHWQIDTLIGRGEVVMLVAHGNSLKTWLAFSMGQAIASGRPWLGRFSVERGRAGLIDFENDPYEMLRRLKMLGVKDEAVEDRLLRASYPNAAFSDPETWVGLASGGFCFLSIDSFNSASPETDENDARAALMLNHSGRFATHTGCTVVWIHHARKGSGGDRRETVRGSSALFAACDRIFAFDEPEKQTGGIVTTTMRSIKDGAGRSPAPVKVELSDQGLRYVEYTDVDDSEDKPVDNRKLVLDALSAHPTGLQKYSLIDLMKGRKDNRKEVIAQLLVAGLIVEFRDRSNGGRPATVLMLKPGVKV